LQNKPSHDDLHHFWIQLNGHHPLIIGGGGGAASDSRSRSERRQQRQQGGSWMRAMNGRTNQSLKE
jgi:hypothetical protein